jgi:hypothetical protein
MENILKFDNLEFLFIFFIPGFISIRVYNLLVASKPFKSKDYLLDIFTFSVINFAAFFWIFTEYLTPSLFTSSRELFILIFFLIIFIAPIFWPIIYLLIIRIPFIRKQIVLPHATAWDFFFHKRVSCWVKITLISGETVAGLYNPDSYASTHPNEQIYLEKLYKYTEKDGFVEEIEQTMGCIIWAKDIKIIEFFKGES